MAFPLAIPFILPTFLKSIKTFIVEYWKPILFVAILTAEYFFVTDINNNKWKIKIATDAEIVRKEIEKKQNEFDVEKRFIADAFESYRQSHPKIEYKKVIEYVTIYADSKCSIPYGWVHLHEAALGREVPGNVRSGFESYDIPTKIKLSEVGEVVSTNYNICLTEMEKLESLQATVRAFQKKQRE